jgi:multidrug efflux system outer membrane protein
MSQYAFRKLALPLTLTLVLSGCSLAPDYKRPDAPVPGQYPAYSGLPAGDTGAAAGNADVAITPDLGWEDFFRDPRLKHLIQVALENNRDMRIAVERVEAARAQYGITESARWPTIGVGATGTIQKNPPQLSQGGDSVSRVYQAGVGMSVFELDFFGRVKNLSEAAYQDYLATEQAQRTVHINLVAQVAEAYLRLRAAQQQYALVKNTLASYKQSYNLVKSRYDAGVASILDLSQAESQLHSAQSDLQSTRRTEARARNALRLLLGVDRIPATPKGAPFDRDQLVATVPVGLPSTLLERRPDIIGAEDELRAAYANIGAARAAFFPNISITGMLGFASNELDGLFGAGNHFWSFGPSIQIPFMSGSVINNLKLAEANKKIAVSSYEKTVQTAFREVADALAGEATYTRQLDALRAQQKSAYQALKASQSRYDAGIDSYLQVQTAEITLYGVQLGLLQTGLDSLLNRIGLYQALGGGWLEQSTTTPANGSAAPGGAPATSGAPAASETSATPGTPVQGAEQGSSNG